MTGSARVGQPTMIYYVASSLSVNAPVPSTSASLNFCELPSENARRPQEAKPQASRTRVAGSPHIRLRLHVPPLHIARLLRRAKQSLPTAHVTVVWAGRHESPEHHSGQSLFRIETE